MLNSTRRITYLNQLEIEFLWNHCNRHPVIENIFFSGSSYKRRLKISSSVEKTANHPLPQIAFFQSDQSEKISKWCQAGFQRNRTLHLPVSTFSGLLNPYEIKQIVYCQFCPLPQFLLRERQLRSYRFMNWLSKEINCCRFICSTLSFTMYSLTMLSFYRKKG